MYVLRTYSGVGHLPAMQKALALVSFYSTAKEKLSNKKQDKPDSLSPLLQLAHWLIPHFCKVPWLHRKPCRLSLMCLGKKKKLHTMLLFLKKFLESNCHGKLMWAREVHEKLRWVSFLYRRSTNNSQRGVLRRCSRTVTQIQDACFRENTRP